MTNRFQILFSFQLAPLQHDVLGLRAGGRVHHLPAGGGAGAGLRHQLVGPDRIYWEHFIIGNLKGMIRERRELFRFSLRNLQRVSSLAYSLCSFRMLPWGYARRQISRELDFV